jgi:hypothetical protein
MAALPAVTRTSAWKPPGHELPMVYVAEQVRVPLDVVVLLGGRLVVLLGGRLVVLDGGRLVVVVLVGGRLAVVVVVCPL